MKICPYCKNNNEDSNKFCISCGAPLDEVKPAVEEPAVAEPAESFYEPEPVDNEPASPEPESLTNPNYNYNTQPSGYNQQVTPIPIGGYIAWSIAVILFCTIPGVIALYYVLKINKATTVEEQQKTLDTAKKILIAGTVLGVLNLISTIGANM